MIDWQRIVLNAAGYPEIREPEDKKPGCIEIPERDPNGEDKAYELAMLLDQ